MLVSTASFYSSCSRSFFFLFSFVFNLALARTKQVAASFPLPPPGANGFSSSKEATTSSASSSSSSPPPSLPSRLLGLKTPLQERVEAAAALAVALGRGNLSYPPSPSSSTAAAAKHDAVSASVAAADAVVLLAWGDASEALGAAADAADAALSSVDDLFLKHKESSGKNSSSSAPVASASVAPTGPLRSAEATNRAATGAVSGKAASTLDAAAGALINKTRASWSDKARPRLSRAAEALSSATGGKPLPVEAEGRLELGVGSALSAADGKRAALRAAADASVAEKLAGGSKRIGEMGILVSLELGDDPLDRGVGTGAPSSSSSFSSLRNAVSAPAAADGWDPSLLTNTGGPDFFFDGQLVPVRAVGDAFEALVRSRLAADGLSGLARRLASAAVALDPQRGLYEVRLAWRSGGSSTLASAIAAVNDADPRDPCRSWAEYFDVCSAIRRSSALKIVRVHARADTAPPGAHAGRMQLGRRLRGGALPSTVGSPQVVEYKNLEGGGGSAGEQDGQAVSTPLPWEQVPLREITQGNLKDLYWYIDKTIEGFANIANGYKEWQNIGKITEILRLPNEIEIEVQRVASDASKKWASGLTTALGGVRGLLGIVGGAVFIAGLATAFLPPQPDPAIMKSLGTIQVVTNETLARVKEIQQTLGVIQQTLADISSDIAKSTCTLALTTTDASVTALRSLYRSYYGPLDAESTDQTPGFVDQLAVYLAARKQADRTLVADIDKWVDAVLRTDTGALYHIDYIFGRISGRTFTEESVLQQCRKFFLDNVAESGPMPIDDRMLYADMAKIVTVSRVGAL